MVAEQRHIQYKIDQIQEEIRDIIATGFNPGDYNKFAESIETRLQMIENYVNQILADTVEMQWESQGDSDG